MNFPPLTHTAGGGGPLEWVGPETHVHKITNVHVFYMALGLNDFDAGKFLTQAIGRGGF